MKEGEEFWEDVSRKNSALNNATSLKPDNLLDLMGNFATPNFVNEKFNNVNNNYRFNKANYSGIYAANKKDKEENYLTFQNFQQKSQGKHPQKQLQKNSYNGHNKENLAPKKVSKGKPINAKRLKKFQNFLKKYEAPKRPSSLDRASLQTTRNSKKRTDTLYEHAKMKNMYIEKIYNQNQNQKMVKALQDCTFRPRINKKSRQISQTKLNSSLDIYERNVDWDLQRNEKIKNKKKRRAENAEEFLYRPQISENDLSSVFNNKMTIKNDASTVLFLERQEKARKNKFECGRGSYSTRYGSKYRSCSTETSHRSKQITNVFMTKCKQVLHDELLDSVDYDEYDS